MPNPDHVALAKRGAEAIAQWRQKRPGQALDLKEADLADCDLRQADLTGADLSLADLDRARLSGSTLAGCRLRGASLIGASFSSANMAGVTMRLASARGADLAMAFLADADLRKADLAEASLRLANLQSATLADATLARARLSDADLRGADLSGADLTGADLAGADLSGARLYRTRLTDADFTRAHCGGTLFADLDLSAAKDLETMDHGAPSTLGLDTVCASRGALPRPFLRGCGIPVELAATLSAQAAALGAARLSCFVSYSARDRDFGHQLATRMRQESLRVWDAADVGRGWKTAEEMEAAMRGFDKWVLVLSADMLRSEWVLTELRKAREAEERGRRFLYPLRLVDQRTVKKWLASEAVKAAGLEPAGLAMADFSKWDDPGAFEQAYARFRAELCDGAG